MKHTTLVDNIQREIIGGSTLVNGTYRSVTKGLTLVNGVQREISGFEKRVVTLVGSTGMEESYVFFYSAGHLSGIQHRGPGSYELPVGAIIRCQGYAYATDNGISYNGEPVGKLVEQIDYKSAIYDYEFMLTENVTIRFGDMGSIAITT